MKSSMGRGPDHAIIIPDKNNSVSLVVTYLTYLVSTYGWIRGRHTGNHPRPLVCKQIAEIRPLRRIPVDGPPFTQLRDAVPVEDCLGGAVDMGPDGGLGILCGDVVGHVLMLSTCMYVCMYLCFFLT